MLQRPPTLSSPTRRPTAPYDCENGEDAPSSMAVSVAKDGGGLHFGAKLGSSIIRTRSFSGTFTSATAPAHAPAASQRASTTFGGGGQLIAVLCAAMLIITTLVGAWAYASRVDASTRAIAADVREIKATLQELSMVMHEQGVRQANGIFAAKAEQTKLGEALTERVTAAQNGLSKKLQPELAKLEAAIAEKATAEQIMSRLANPFGLVLQRLARLEAAAASHAPTATAHSDAAVAAAAAVPPSGREEGMVEVTFSFEPRDGAARAASLLWLGKRGADGTHAEVKYTEIPRGMRVKETTRPGECWRARDAATHAILLDKHCATIEPHQEVLIS